MRSGAIAPLLAATAVHCFLDGWSIRALGNTRTTGLALALGLALHKLPEGFALGWILRRAVESAGKAILLAVAVEALTVVAAYIEPNVNASGATALGPWWTPGVLAVIAGSFLYFGFHVVIPERRKRGVIPLFAGTLVIMAGAAWAKA